MKKTGILKKFEKRLCRNLRVATGHSQLILAFASLHQVLGVTLDLPHPKWILYQLCFKCREASLNQFATALYRRPTSKCFSYVDADNHSTSSRDSWNERKNILHMDSLLKIYALNTPINFPFPFFFIIP